MVQTAKQLSHMALPEEEQRRNVYDVLQERGFVAQVSDEAELRKALERPAVTLYCGYDPTATSLHIGHQLTLMMLAHFQRHGHRPIALLGGGTGMIGDPTDKATMRPVLAERQIEQNIAALRPIFARYLDFGAAAGSARALMLDNADWLLQLRYISFLRDIGIHFSVNQLLSHSTYRERLESEGQSLNFIEINYVLLQAYDFLQQYREFGCTLQIGGSDQWFNILAGAELIRRADGGRAFALVAPLLTTSSGEKMGKTAGGEKVWLDPAQTPPYDYYQYWVNVPDDQVEQLLKLYTFLPLEEVATLAQLEGADIRRAKEVLAFEATRLTHGEEEARKAQAGARALFAGPDAAGDGDDAAVPTTTVPRATIEAGVPLVDLLTTTGLAKSKSEARRLIAQGGAYVDDEQVTDAERTITTADLDGEGRLLLRAGKKRYHRIVAE